MKPRNERSWLASFLGRYKRSVAVALALGLVASGCAALLMFASGYLISATAVPGMTLFSIMVPIAFVQLFGFGRPLARYLERLVSHDWVLKVTSDLRLMLYRGIGRRFADPARKRAVGEYLGLLADDIAHLQNLYLRVVFPTAIAYLLAVAATVAFGLFSAPFALLMLLVFLLVAVALPFATLLATRAQAEYAKTLKADLHTRLVDDVLGATDWVLSGRAEEVAMWHADADARQRAVERRLRLAERLASLISTLVLGAAICAVVVWSGDSFAGDAALANYIAAFTIGFFPLVEAFSALPAAFGQIPVHEDAIARLGEYASEDASIVADSRPSVTELEGADSEALSALEFDDVCYRYPNAIDWALDGFTISIGRSEKVAILGRSGSGKSTFAHLALKTLEPVTGSVLVNGTLGFLGQTPHLFNRTLRENMTLGVVDADDELIEQALGSVGLGERLRSLPDGLDTIVGETGTGFSGGEEHRIAMARLLLTDAGTVLVDEPFSSLDPKTEGLLLDTLFRAFGDRTLVVITHHLAQIERFDRAVFVEDGAIALDGAPAELLETSELFRELVEFDRGGARAGR